MFGYSRESHTSQVDYHCVPRKEKGRRRVILPSVALLTPCYLKVTTRGRKLSRAVFHMIHLSSPHHMCSSVSLLQTRCAYGGRSYLITSRLIKSIIFHFIFITDNCIITRKSLTMKIAKGMYLNVSGKIGYS